jgi:two-component sensor histidine kinase
MPYPQSLPTASAGHGHGQDQAWVYDDSVGSLRPQSLDSASAPGEAELLPVREAQHRFYNALTTVRFLLEREFNGFADPAVRAAAAKVDAQIMAIGDAQRSLTSRGHAGWLDAPVYFGSICSALEAAQLAPRGVRCEIHAEPGLMPMRVAHTLALIVVELVTNAAKHGFGERGYGNVRVHLRRTAQGWLCAVQDDGGGLQGDHVGEGSGLVAALARSIGAELRIQSDAGGVLASLVVPEPEASSLESGARRPAA